MQKISVLVALLCLVVSCKKDSASNVHGLYTESVAGRSQLNFISSNVLIRTETGSGYKDTFYYSFSNGKILLTPAWTNQYPAQEFDFAITDENSFQIENLYPSLPETPKSYMMFKK